VQEGKILCFPGSEVETWLIHLQQALVPIWVNVHDFIRERNTGQKCKHFESERALASYTMRKKLFYPKKRAKAEGPIRALLARIFSN
jgi:hypothetical protein